MAVQDDGELSSVAHALRPAFATVDTIQFRSHLSNYHADRTKSLLPIGEQSLAGCPAAIADRRVTHSGPPLKQALKSPQQSRETMHVREIRRRHVGVVRAVVLRVPVLRDAKSDVHGIAPNDCIGLRHIGA